MRSLRGFVLRTLIVLAVCSAAATALARPQPMAVPPQQISLAPKESSKVAAYCLDYKRDLPSRGVTLAHVVDGPARACIGGICKSLQEAIAADEVAVRGTDGFGLTFENLTDRPVSIDLSTNTAFAVEVEPVRSPSMRLQKQYSEVDQLRLWQSLRQVGDVVGVAITARGTGGYDVTGFDAVHGPVVKVQDVARADLAKVIADLAGETRALLIDAPFEPERLRALVASVRIQTSSNGVKGALGTAKVSRALAELLEKPAKLGKMEEPRVGDKDVRTALELATPTSSVSAELVVEFRRAQSPPSLEKVADRVKRGVHRARSSRQPTMLRTAATVRDAVKDEIMELARTDGSDVPTVWVMIGDSLRGYIIVKIEPGEATWAG